ncbi:MULTISPECIES: hypothetical protein [Streptomyces]|uniref:Transposase n=1 Tax=Streptomyces nymphaeiformis TaxID=2663842 RepID=A0A7W7U049_9ACTN|nr:hypothetical protein [Streptomyces nymphaeiformis]MBB4981702.1 hypothetical protein [Streptomyces nymphaeiformis]
MGFRFSVTISSYRTHGYVRGGVIPLFAALDTATGEVIGQIQRRLAAPRISTCASRPPVVSWFNRVERRFGLSTDERMQ